MPKIGDIVKVIHVPTNTYAIGLLIEGNEFIGDIALIPYCSDVPKWETFQNIIWELNSDWIDNGDLIITLAPRNLQLLYSPL